MARNWTPQQRSAIESRSGTLLLSAAAGSGKTAVLVERVLGLMLDAEHPVDVDRLLVMTFSNAAAKEMKQRISQRLGEKLRQDPRTPPFCASSCCSPGPTSAPSTPSACSCCGTTSSAWTWLRTSAWRRRSR